MFLSHTEEMVDQCLEEADFGFDGDVSLFPEAPF